MAMLLSTPKLLEAYDLKSTTVEKKLEEFPTAIDDMMSIDEFVNFMLFPDHLVIHQDDQDKKPYTF